MSKPACVSAASNRRSSFGRRPIRWAFRLIRTANSDPRKQEWGSTDAKGVTGASDLVPRACDSALLNQGFESPEGRSALSIRSRRALICTNPKPRCVSNRRRRPRPCPFDLFSYITFHKLLFFKKKLLPGSCCYCHVYAITNTQITCINKTDKKKRGLILSSTSRRHRCYKTNVMSKCNASQPQPPVYQSIIAPHPPFLGGAPAFMGGPAS